MIDFRQDSKVAILGAGAMGSGIAQIAAQMNHQVIVYDVKKESLTKSEDNLDKVLVKLIGKKKIGTEEAAELRSKISYTSAIKDIKDCDLIIEAVIENLEIKKELFAKVEKYVKKDAILATNTSSLSIAAISSALKNPSRFIGLHFFNPAPVMPLVEIVPSFTTDETLANSMKRLMTDWKKTPVIAKDTPGFIVNRVARPFYAEALRIYEEGIADFATIDWAMKEKGDFKMGPFELMDFIGNDVNYKVTETVFEQMYFDPKFTPSVTQKRFVESGLFGRKVGRGFYDYSDGAIIPKPRKDNSLGDKIFYRILFTLINQAADAVQFNIASPEDIDIAMTKGVNYPKGLLAWADEIGLEEILTVLEMLQEDYGERYRPSAKLRKMAVKNRRFFNK